MSENKNRKSSGWRLQEISYPSYCSELAELVGIMLGDGSIYGSTRNNKLVTHQVTIVGDSVKDRDYLTKYVTYLFQYLFGIQPSYYYSKCSNALYVKVRYKKLLEYLLSIGLKFGNKIKSQVTIPNWIWQDDNYLRACIRGLYDTDGSIYELLPHWPGLFQLSFDNRNMTLLQDVRKVLLHLGFKVSNICAPKTDKTPKIYITRKAEVRKFFEEIGFSNPKHYRKVQKAFPNISACNSPVVQWSNFDS